MATPQKDPRQPLLSLPQLLVLAVVLTALVLVMGAGSRQGRGPGPEQAILETRLAVERERNQQLLVTLTYVHSDDHVADYARDEGGMILPGEMRVVPLLQPPPPTATPVPPPISASIAPSTPFEAWWALFFDSPPPGR